MIICHKDTKIHVASKAFALSGYEKAKASREIDVKRALPLPKPKSLLRLSDLKEKSGKFVIPICTSFVVTRLSIKAYYCQPIGHCQVAKYRQSCSGLEESPSVKVPFTAVLGWKTLRYVVTVSSFPPAREYWVGRAKNCQCRITRRNWSSTIAR